MRYFSMFSGIGGFELGIGANGECIGYSEIDIHAIKTYEEHFSHENFGDATRVDPSKLPDFELLVGGFPCQAFSVAGKRRGFDEARGTLFFDIARVLEHKRPRHLVLENVKGLLSHDAGRTYQTILGVLSDLGYRVEWQVLNSKDFGVPQNRERIYIVGHLRDRCAKKVLPITGEVKTTLGDHIGTINRGKFKHTGGRALTIGATHHKGHDNHGSRPMVVTPHIRWGKGTRTTHHTLDEIMPTIRATHYKSGDNQAKVLDSHRIRRLMPVECERLQGFPDGWTLGSDTQRYKQCGNAVTVNVVAAVIGALLDES